MKDILTSYNQAEYHIDGFTKPIKIGKIHTGVEKLLMESGVSTWAFVTAWNPLSVALSNKENANRNQELKKELAPFQFLNGEGRDQNGEWKPESSFLVLGISRRKSKELGRSFGQRAIVFGELGKPAELIETLFTLGNCEIIRENKTAFLCSRKIPASVVLKCYDWAIEQRDQGNCVISGFHSTIEKDVFYYLLKGNQPIIIALARGMLKRFDATLMEAIENGRILVISPFDEKVVRASRNTAKVRNKFMTDLAEAVAIGHADPEGMLAEIIEGAKSKTIYV